MALTEKERMVAGALYRPGDDELLAARRRARALCREFNASTEEDAVFRRRILAGLFGAVGPRVEIEPPFHCDYGFNIRAGDNLFANFACVFLDCAPITLGRNVFLGPCVQLYAATHPLDHRVRAQGQELARPISIGDDVWIGGGVIVCPGVSIGDRCVIGAGSIVTRDVPAGHLAVGHPCRVVRRLDQA